MTIGTDIPRILLETLRQTKDDRDAWIYHVSSQARSTSLRVKTILSIILEREIEEHVHLSPAERFKIVFTAASHGVLGDVARTLNWKEFEVFAEECLAKFGYQTERNVRFSSQNRRWEIDVVAVKDTAMLCIDCKHWQRGSPGRLRSAVDHQKKAMVDLAHSYRQRLDGPHDLWGLPVILTLFENLQPFLDGGVLVSVQRLSDFLANLTIYDYEIPFVHLSNGQKAII